MLKRYVWKMRAERFHQLVATGDLELLSHSICDEAEKALEDGKAEPLEFQLQVLAVETFYGEVTNDGIQQFLANQDGRTVNITSVALRSAGLVDYADVMASALELFPSGVASLDHDEKWNQMEVILENSGDDIFDKIEEPFWARYFDDKAEIRTKLHEFIIAHESELVT